MQEAAPSSPDSATSLRPLVHPVALLLAQRFAGWLEDYSAETADWWAGAVTPGQPSTLLQLPVALAVLVQAGVMDWSATAPCGTRWNPFAEAYSEFVDRFPAAEPFLQECPPERWVALGWFLAKFGSASADAGCAP